MKLDASALRYLSDDDFRVLTAVEMGMRNHDCVPVPLIDAISGLKHGGTAKSLREVHKHKLVHRESKRYVGYRLTSLGYDYLALRALVRRGVLGAVGRPLGVGKEADVVLAAPSEELLEENPAIAEELCPHRDADAAENDEADALPMVAMKIHRLGRTSFRAVKAKRDYMAHRKSASWIYMSRLAAIKEYAFMCALHERDFPVPRPLGHSRHVVIMQLVDGVPLNQVSELHDAPGVATRIIDVIARLAAHGLVHCDLNEFNIMIGDDERVTVIDFPQMVSTRHPDAKMFYDRDLDGVVRFFAHRFGMNPEEVEVVAFEDAAPSPEDEAEGEGDVRIDVMLAASGFGSAAGASASGEDSKELVLDGVADDVDAFREDVQGILDLKTLSLPTEQDDGGEGTGDAGAASSALAEPVPTGEDVGAGQDDRAERDDGDEGDEDGDVNATESVVDESDTASTVAGSVYSVGGTRIMEARIADRVRRQRSNQARRKQFAKRNLVKDAEKRRIKVEVEGTSIWG